jgi:glucose-6-phosphate isomerase
MKVFLGEHQDDVIKNFASLSKHQIVNRIWKKDYTVWKNDPTEISNRLGWLDCIDVTKKKFNEINSFIEEIRTAGFTQALIMGMGGSSLAPEVFRLTFGVKNGYLDLHVLDSTHPEAVLKYEKELDASKTLYIVSTKSGGTIETISFMKFFFNIALKKLGREKASKNFIAITDPGSGLEVQAKNLNFRKIFLNDPDIGGRFSALSLFGIVPAALIGIDLEKLFSRARGVIRESKVPDLQNNKSAALGAIIGSLAAKGVDKLTIISSPQIEFFGAWLEQLIAESTGKDGKGILPVDLEIVNIPENYYKDRAFVNLKLKGDSTFDKKVEALKAAGFPVIEFTFDDSYDLGSEFFRWEFATAIAGYVLDVQPFDQPNVESAKLAARNMMKQYSEKGKLPSLNPAIIEDGIKVYGDVKSKKLKDVLNEFLSSSEKGKSYVSIQAYLNPDEKTWQKLQLLRLKILQKYKIATTLGYGPRFLHSTGQLHKGDGGNGLFIQILADAAEDVPIPDNAGEEKSSISFGTLIKAQSLGDRQALIDNERKILQFNLGTSIIDCLAKLSNHL